MIREPLRDPPLEPERYELQRAPDWNFALDPSSKTTCTVILLRPAKMPLICDKPRRKCETSPKPATSVGMVVATPGGTLITGGSFIVIA